MTAENLTCRAQRRLRADAERNRAAIVAAARDVFAEHGIEASLEEIALRAGVGIATLYRRFPAREQLVAAALIDKVTEYAEAADQALAAGDPWDGFVAFVQRICQLQADDRGLSELLCMALPAGEHVERLRHAANDKVVELVRRAKESGRLREDFVGEDLLVLLVANAAVVHVTRPEAPDAWRRFVDLVLDAFARQDSPPLPAPPSTDEMARAMLRLARERGCGSRGLPTPQGRSCCQRGSRLSRNARIPSRASGSWLVAAMTSTA
jgi:AcrR family transcriptional regulator